VLITGSLTMSPQSLIIRFCAGDNNVVIFDVHNNRQLKTLGVGTQEQFKKLNTLVRNGEVSF